MGDQDPRDYRESITLGDLKRQLRVRPVSELPHFQGLGVTDAAIEAYLMRFLRAKHLSTAEAIAKLKRRRAYETTLPTIRVTPAVVAALRSGAISILGLDNCQRPILFLDLSVFQLPTLAVDEAQRLLILLLEYMQSKCLASACNSNNSNNNDASNKNNGAAPTGKYAQQFVLLVNESGSSWQGHVPIMRKASAVYSVFSKYYPMLLDLVLVCDASFEVRQGVKAALAGSPASFSKTIQLVQRSDLTRYMRADLLPPTLGGRADRRASIDGEAAQSGTDLAESVMRHWYTLTSYIQLENSSSASPSPQASGGAAAPPSPSSSPSSSSSAVPARPLYVPPPFVTSAPSLACFQKNITVPSSARSSPGRITSNAIDPLAATYNSEAGSVYMRQSFKTALSNNSSMRGGTLTRDDGVCSAIFSDDEELGVLHTAFEDDEPGAADAVACAFGADAALTEEERARLQADPTLALSALEAERGRRFATEQRLRLLELGVVMDMKHATDIERQLAAIHQEINVLVADVVLKARVTQQRGGGGNGPSVSQLLDLTLSALERAGDVPEEVPAMSLATPAQREPSSLVCCTLM